jgi:hypothetical protein
MVREGVTSIETGFGREEDIDLLWSIQSKLKNTMSFRETQSRPGSQLMSLYEEFEYETLSRFLRQPPSKQTA